MATPTRTILVIGVLPDSLVLFRQQLLADLVARGHRVVACAARRDPLCGMAGGDVEERLRRLGVSYRPVPLVRTGLNPWRDLQTLGALVSLCREVRPDVMLTYTAKAVIYGSLAGWLTRVPRRIAMLTGLGKGTQAGGDRGPVAAAIRALYRWSLAKCDGVIFHNPDDREALRAHGLLPARVATVVVNGSGVDLARFTVAVPPDQPLTFLLIARLLREKGVLEYVEAAREVKAQYPQTSFLLVGPLDSHPDAIRREHVQAWEQEGLVRWLGSVDDVRPSLAACSVYVLPSYHEGTPRTVLEAMATGRAIITTDAPGCRETVSDGVNGFLVPVGDAHALAMAMRRFVEQPQLIGEFGRCSRELAEAKYDVHAVNAAMLQFMGV